MDTEIMRGEWAGDAFGNFPDGEPGQGSRELEGVRGEDLIGLDENFIGRDEVGHHLLGEPGKFLQCYDVDFEV